MNPITLEPLNYSIITQNLKVLFKIQKKTKHLTIIIITNMTNKIIKMTNIIFLIMDIKCNVIQTKKIIIIINNLQTKISPKQKIINNNKIKIASNI